MSPLPVATITEMAVIPVAAAVATTEATVLMTLLEAVAEEPTEAAETKLLPMFLLVRPLSKPSTSRARAMPQEQTTMRKKVVNPRPLTLCTHSAHLTTAVQTLIVHTVVVDAATLSEVIAAVLAAEPTEAAVKAATTIIAVVALTTTAMATKTEDLTTDGKKLALITMFRRK